MSKLFKTLCTLLVISSQAGAFNLKPLRNIPTGDLLPFFETLQETPDANDLARLYRVESSLPSVIKQPHSEFDLLYQKAISGQTELEAITKQIVKQSGAIIHSSGVKSKPRAIDKINSDFAGSSEHITDLARTSIVAQNVATLVKSFELFESQTQIVRIKNRFISPGASGYRDISLLVRLPETKIIAEVQLHLAAFSEIKNGQEHHNYEQIQQIERLQFSENRPLTEIELASINKLRVESRQLYQYAWNQYLAPSGREICLIKPFIQLGFIYS